MLVKSYYFELRYRCFYLLTSIILCSIVVFCNIHSLLLFITYSFLYSFHQKFIFTNLTELIELFWFLIPSTSFMFILPFFIHQVKLYFKNSFYFYQVYILNLNINLIYTSWVFNTLICWWLLTPLMLDFLLNWNLVNQSQALFLIETQLKILDYTKWIYSFLFQFVNLITILIMIFYQFYCLLAVECIYYCIKNHKKLIIFLSISFSFLFFSSDLLFQSWICINIWSFYQFLFFFFCFKLRNSM